MPCRHLNQLNQTRGSTTAAVIVFMHDEQLAIISEFKILFAHSILSNLDNPSKWSRSRSHYTGDKLRRRICDLFQPTGRWGRRLSWKKSWRKPEKLALPFSVQILLFKRYQILTNRGKSATYTIMSGYHILHFASRHFCWYTCQKSTLADCTSFIFLLSRCVTIP